MQATAITFGFAVQTRRRSFGGVSQINLPDMTDLVWRVKCFLKRAFVIQVPVAVG